MEEPAKNQRLERFAPWAACLAVVCAFHASRLLRPTFLGDDVIRIIDARVMPLRQQLFRPFSEHVAPGFELLTAALIRPLGDRIDLLPAALTAFAFASWLVMLAAAAWWAKRLTGQPDAARLVFVFLGVSSACIEVPWWFSAATYSLAAACVFAVLAAIAGPPWKPVARAAFIAAVTALGMSFSAVGLMAVILGGLASLARFGPKRAAMLDIASLAFGFLAYSLVARLFGGEIVATETTRFSLSGFAYALAVPGGIAAPLFLGIDANAVTAWFTFPGGTVVTLLLALGLRRARSLGSTRLDLAAMAVVPYAAIYPARAALVDSGAWTLPDFLYFWTSRYHLFMTAALALAAALVLLRLRRIVADRGFRIPGVWVLLLAIPFAARQYHNADLMRHFEMQPDQAPTLQALVRLGRVAAADGISIDTLARILPPVRRGWNASVLELRPDRFPHVMLLDSRSTSNSARQSALSDAEAVRNVIDKLGLGDWRVLNAHRLANLDPAEAIDMATARAVAPADPSFAKAESIDASSWRILEPFGHVEFTIRDLPSGARLVFEDPAGEGTMHIQWSTDANFDDPRTLEFESIPAKHRPVPHRILLRTDDLRTESAPGTPPAVRVRLKLTRAGTIRISRILAVAPMAPSR